jgi:rhodanese-related sulfurtransferase
MKHSTEFEALVDEARPRVREITVDELQAMKRYRLIDVREDDEWRAGHARGAEHIGRGVLERDIIAKAPDKNEELILYCGGGYRSVLACDNLRKMGYTRASSLVGGWKEWLKRGLPVDGG